MNRNLQTSIKATAHCLLGCSIGEVLGMVIATYLGLSNGLSIILSVILAFVFGYSLTLVPLIRNGIKKEKAIKIAIASDTVSISTMEIIDNLVIILIPAALNASLSDSLFWKSLIVSLFAAFIVTIPVNYFLISKGKGHDMSHHH